MFFSFLISNRPALGGSKIDSLRIRPEPGLPQFIPTPTICVPMEEDFPKKKLKEKDRNFQSAKKTTFYISVLLCVIAGSFQYGQGFQKS